MLGTSFVLFGAWHWIFSGPCHRSTVFGLLVCLFLCFWGRSLSSDWFIWFSILGGVYMGKFAPVRVPYRNVFWFRIEFKWIRNCLFIWSLHGSIVTSTSWINEIYACTIHRKAEASLHDTLARFRPGLKFSPRVNYLGRLAPVWLAQVWHFLVVSCKRIQSHNREPCEKTHLLSRVLIISFGYGLVFTADD